MCKQHLLHGFTSLLVEAVELHVHGLDDPCCDGASNRRRIIFGSWVIVLLKVGGVVVLVAVVLQEGSLWWAPFRHRQVVVDGDVVVQVLIVGDGSTRVRGDIVKGDVLAQGVVGDSIVQAEQVLTLFSHVSSFPITILDGYLVGAVVDLDVQGLEDRSADQQRRVALHNESLNVSSLTFNVDWKSD